MALSEKGLYDDVKAFLEFSFQSSPELILLGLAQLTVPWAPLHKELASNLVMMFLCIYTQKIQVCCPGFWTLHKR
ncbi:hypothetical protein BC829DRAFT_769 [Chytridium lagenaria]|nr:hypothetical protein BC829DRAFT_769 [Chytridium lagenaria]